MSRAFIWFIAIKYHSFLINQKSPHFYWMHLGTIDHRWWALMFMASLMWDINEPLRKPEEFNLDFVLPAGKIMLRFDSVIFYASPSWGSNKRRRGCWDIVLDGRTNYWILNRGKGRGGATSSWSEGKRETMLHPDALWFTYKYRSDIAQRRNDLWRDYSCILSHMYIYGIQSLNLSYRKAIVISYDILR